MFNPDTSPQSKFFMRSIEAAAPSHGVQAVLVPVRTTADIEPAFEGFARAPNGGLMYYGASINVPDQFRQAATYVDRIFKVVKPGDLPSSGRTNTRSSSISKPPRRSGSMSLPLTGLADELIE